MPVGAEGGLDGEGGGPPRTASEARRLALPTFVMDLPVTRRALAFAEEHHRGQLRDVDRAPFILHPLEVAQLLRGRDYPDEVVAAGVLHDIIEDAHVAFEELRATFGLRVAALVRAVSEPIDASGSYRERKARLRAAVAEAEATRSRCSPPTRSPSRVSCAWDWCGPAASPCSMARRSSTIGSPSRCSSGASASRIPFVSSASSRGDRVAPAGGEGS